MLKQMKMENIELWTGRYVELSEKERFLREILVVGKIESRKEDQHIAEKGELNREEWAKREGKLKTS
jgi:hypothetical protein